MNGLLLLALLGALLWVGIFFRLSLVLFSTGTILILLVLMFLLKGNHLFDAFALTTILIVICFNIPHFRRLMIKPILKYFVKVLPPMSSTEKEAIAAGEVGWEKTLFQGNPDWSQLLASAQAALTTEEIAFLNYQVENLCQMLDDWQIVHEQSDFSLEVWQYLKNEKFFGMIIPKKYGGLEFSALGHSAVIVKIATRSISAAVTAMVPNSLAPAELLLHYGTEEQKNTYLPLLAKGEEIPCFALTSPEAGSDAAAIQDQGYICKGMHNQQEVIGIRLTFDKRYITLAPIATVIGLAFKLYDPDHLLSNKEEYGITLCLIPREHPGLEIGPRHFPLNMAFMNGPIRGQNLFIPLDWIIGGIAMAGKGWGMLMECLAAGRGISLPALSTASSILAYRMTGAYATIRQQFKLPIAKFEGVEEALIEIAGYTYLLQATRQCVASHIAVNKAPVVATAIAKYHMTEIGRKVINHAMDVHGGKGIMLGPNNYLARAYQAAPVSITVEGANILTRCLIIFGQGAIRCHPFIRNEMAAAEIYDHNPKQALKIFDKNFTQHVGYFISNMVRCFTFSLTGGRLSNVAGIRGSDYWVRQLNCMSVALATTSDMALLILGGDLKRQERLSARLGDVLSQLYLAAAALRYYYANGEDENEWPYCHWVMQTCLFQIQESFYGFFANFGHPLISLLLKLIIFPFGKKYSPPNDLLGKKLLLAMLNTSSIRQRLTDLCYVGEGEPTAILESAFEKFFVAQPLLLKIQQAIKVKKIDKNDSFAKQLNKAVTGNIISHEEGKLLEEFKQLQLQVISVDEFKNEYGLGTQSNAN